MAVYYNEFDPKAAAWLRELIRCGHLPKGEVDEKSIADVVPSDIRGFTQAHFFAGIGGWPYALRMAGWPDDRPVWTGSAPCQPFSNAGKRAGYDDERHLAPVWLDLIGQCRPPIIFGEQVAGADGRNWLSDLRLEMEGLGYAVGAADLCAAGAGAPHIRQRLFFGAVLGDRPGVAGANRTGGASRLADSASAGRKWGRAGETSVRQTSSRIKPERLCNAERLGDTCEPASQRHARSIFAAQAKVGSENGSINGDKPDRFEHASAGVSKRMGTGLISGLEGHAGNDSGAGGWSIEGRSVATAGGDSRPDAFYGFWRDADWLHCTDEKWRPVEPGTFPLGHGLPARVGRLRGYGNAIVPQIAATFIEEFEGAVKDIAQ